VTIIGPDGAMRVMIHHNIGSFIHHGDSDPVPTRKTQIAMENIHGITLIQGSRGSRVCTSGNYGTVEYFGEGELRVAGQVYLFADQESVFTTRTEAQEMAKRQYGGHGLDSPVIGCTRPLRFGNEPGARTRAIQRHRERLKGVAKQPVSSSYFTNPTAAEHIDRRASLCRRHGSWF
jgi:hypothetical protein